MDFDSASMTEAPQPWDQLADASQRLTDATRAVELAAGGDDLDRALAAVDLECATGEYERARDRMGLVAAVILQAAVSGFGHNGTSFLGGGEMFGTPHAGYVLPATWESIGHALGVPLCFGMAEDAKKYALFAERKLSSLMLDLDHLHDEVRKLRRQVEDMAANRIPGVGEPSLRVVG